MSQALPHKMPALDGLRGVAALAVVFSHAGPMMLHVEFAPQIHLAVWFFWMLSGFVLAHAYGAKLQAGMPLRSYIVARLIRLYPLIVLGALAGLAALLLTSRSVSLADPRTLVATLAAMLCVPSPVAVFPYGYWPINGPEWSMFWEVILSVVFGAGLFRAPSWALAAIAGTALAAYACVTPHELLIAGLPATAAFTGGVLLHRIRPTVPSLPFWALGAAVAAVTCVPLDLGRAFDFACLALLFPAIILSAARRTASGQAIRTLGDLSYPAYILHMPVLVVCAAMLTPRIGGLPTMATAVVLAIGTAWAALRLYDAPVRAALSRWAKAQGKDRAARLVPQHHHAPTATLPGR